MKMKYKRLHKCKVEENEHEYATENKKPSNDDQKVKRLSEAIHKLLTTYKGRQQGLGGDVMKGHHQTTMKELWRLCKQYENVIDVFILNRRSKLGKRFGFVRFIKILDVVRLVNNLSTIWIGKFKLHVNIARFNRPLLNKGSHSFNPSANVKPASDASYKKVESRPSSSYIQAAKVGISSLSDAKALKPALTKVLDKEPGAKASFQEDVNVSSCSGHFQSVKAPKSGGSIIHIIEDFIKVGQTMGYKMEGCIKDFEEIETKMEKVDLFNIKAFWGNINFDYVVSPSVGNSSGILCVWDPSLFYKENSTVSDYFIVIMGNWLPNNKKLLVISVYAPQELAEKKSLWK
nr:RNA-directed DNA polymerase, eukaryota, reverse transcriptase zinc-binding domain protein [Tanacetum cinerariifolium]GEX27421.1 RNA-directed DNA polymerase, eukaryota, reverse transcriptase zinc-binding domain protein [Tanacetum cinerariifolium]